MYLYRYLDGFLDSLYKIICSVRSEQCRHILYAYRIRTGILKLFCVFCVVLKIKDRSGRVRHGRLYMSALFLFGGVYCGLEITDIVKRIEYTDDIDTVCYRALHEVFNNIVGIMSVAEHVLSSEKHLELSVRALFAYKAKSCPRVLVKEAKAGVICCAAPALKRVKTDFIKLFKHWKHFLCSHARGDKRLMRVTQHGLCNADLFLHCDLLPLKRTV